MREEKLMSRMRLSPVPSQSKEHMSGDDGDTDTDEGEGGWVSRPPKYRSKTLEAFLNK